MEVIDPRRVPEIPKMIFKCRADRNNIFESSKNVFKEWVFQLLNSIIGLNAIASLLPIVPNTLRLYKDDYKAKITPLNHC